MFDSDDRSKARKRSPSPPDPFARLVPLLKRVPVNEASRLLAVANPLDLHRAISDPPLRVRHLIAIRCAAYARVFHPLHVSSEGGFTAPWRWSRLGGPNITADTTIREVLLAAAEGLSSQRLGVTCEVGKLDHLSATTLASLIGEGNLACPDCHFYFWDGLGIFDEPGQYLYRGSVASVGCFFRAASAHPPTPFWRFQSPTLWWCNDSWFVATHPDAVSTYIGGPSSLIERLVGSPFLEATVALENTTVDDSHLRPDFAWPLH
jgi:hypothetical protein